MTLEGVAWRSSCVAKKKHLPSCSFSFHWMMHSAHLRKKKQTHLHSLEKSNRSETTNGENQGLKKAKHEETTLSIADELFYTFNQNCFYKHFMKRTCWKVIYDKSSNPKIRSFKPLVKRRHFILVNSVCTVVECPEIAIARTPYACARCHDM